MPPTSSRKRRPWRLAALLVALAAFGAYLVFGSLSVVQAECELCVTYHGQAQCRRGSGASEDEARRAAQRAACAVMAAGMSETIECQNVVPTDVRCPPPEGG
jgi:hypothetical protein